MLRYIFISAILIAFCLDMHAQNIVRIEYSIDNFGSEGTGTSIDLSGDDDSIDSVFDLDIDGLEPGPHTLYVRSLNDLGVWSLPVERTFYVQQPDSLIQKNITRMEYSIDGFAREKTGEIIVLDGDIRELDSVVNLDIVGLSGGLHTLHFRALDERGEWSLPVEKSFYVQPPDTGKVKDIFYRFFNDDYTGDWQSSDVTPPRKQVDSTFNLSVAGLTTDTEYSIEFYAVNNFSVRGLSAFSNNFVLRSNHAPNALRENLDVAMLVNKSLSISLDTLFEDEDLVHGDSLVYYIADPEGSGVENFIDRAGSSKIIFQPESGQHGSYDFWFVATDLAQETDSVMVHLEVGQPSVDLVNPIEDRVFDEGFGTYEIDLSDVFSHSEEEALSYEASSGNENVVMVSVAGNTLTISEKGTGTSEITVTATDDNGGEASDVFVVEVLEKSNASPIVFNAIEDKIVEEGFASFEIDLDTVFSDEDGDVLLYSATQSGGDDVILVTLSGSVLTIKEEGLGTVTVFISAVDGNGGEATDEFDMEVKEADGAVTGLGDEAEKSVVIFPNPAAEVLFIELPYQENAEFFEMEMYDMMGKKCLSRKVKYAKTNDVNISQLQNGVYLVRIFMEGEVLIDKILVE